MLARSAPYNPARLASAPPTIVGYVTVTPARASPPPTEGCPKSAPALATPLFTHQRTLTAAPATASARSPRRAGEELLASVTWRLRSRSGLGSERNGQAQQAGDRERGSRRHIDGGCVETLVEAPRATPLHGKQQQTAAAGTRHSDVGEGLVSLTRRQACFGFVLCRSR